MNFSFQSLRFSGPEFQFGSFFIIYISLVIFSVWSNIAFLLSFNSLDMIFFSSLNIFVLSDSESVQYVQHLGFLKIKFLFLAYALEYGTCFFIPLCVSNFCQKLDI